MGDTTSRPRAERLCAGATTEGDGEATRSHTGRFADAHAEDDAQLCTRVVPLFSASEHPGHPAWTEAALRAASFARAPYDGAETGDALHGVVGSGVSDNASRQPAAALVQRCRWLATCNVTSWREVPMQCGTLRHPCAGTAFSRDASPSMRRNRVFAAIQAPLCGSWSSSFLYPGHQSRFYPHVYGDLLMHRCHRR